MKSTITAIGAALVGAAFAASPAAAQQNYGAQAAPQQSAAETPQPAENPNAIKTHTPKVSREASKPLEALQKAINENNSAAIPTALAAAQAAAKTADDRYVLGILQLKAAAAAKDNAGIASAIEAMLASGSVTQEEKFPLYLTLAQTYSAARQDARATQAYQQALEANPGSVDATAGLAEAKIAQGQAAEGLALLKKGIALQSAGGARPGESWYKRAVAVAYKAKLPQAAEISREWVRAYPSSTNWSDSIAIYQNLGQLDETKTIDLLRLKRVVGALSAGDYFKYGDIALTKGLSGETKSVLEQGFAANAIKRSDPSFSQLYAIAAQKTKGDRESLPAAPAANATGRQILNNGDAYYGYGDYAKAAEFYRAALAKGDADKNLVNLHLGMALARQGDKAGATAAFNAAGGPEAELAKYWLLYVSTKA